MAMGVEYPQILASQSASSLYNPTTFTGTVNNSSNIFDSRGLNTSLDRWNNLSAGDHDRVQRRLEQSKLYAQASQSYIQVASTVIPMTDKRRLVQVFILDPDEQVPLDKAMIYQGSQKLTDLNDQELFHEIPITDMLKRHNELRQTTVNKKVKERTEYLEPIRIRDLKMVVVTIASF